MIECSSEREGGAGDNTQVSDLGGVEDGGVAK